MRFHRFWSNSGQAADGVSGGQFGGFSTGADGDGQGGTFGQVLGSSAAGLDGTPKTRAAMAAEARRAMGAGPNEPPVPNFLSMDGSWVVMCPCGQVHDPASCAVAQAVAASNGTAADDAGDVVTDAPASIDAETDKGEAAQDPTGIATDSVEVEVSTDAQGDVDMEGPSPLQPVEKHEISIVNTAVTTIAQESQSIAEDVPMGMVDADINMPAQPDELDISELEMQGLDGAARWLQSFRQKMGSFHAGGPARAQAAVQLLLRLVCNVVESPAEQKFRRIRTDNAKIRAGLLDVGVEAQALIMMLGFEAVTEDGVRFFLLRDAVLDVARLRMGKELLESEVERMKVQVVK